MMQATRFSEMAAKAAAAATLLLEARQQRSQLLALPQSIRPTTVDEGYAIQDELVRSMGGRVVGWKVGCTGPAAQQRVGAREPFAGRLLDFQIRKNPASVGSAESFLRAVQVEFAFKLGRDLASGPLPYVREQVAATVVAVIPTIEIADSRYSDWADVGVGSLIADNAKDGLIVFGAELEDWTTIDLVKERVRLVVNGTRAAEGCGAQVLGDPLLSLVWLANDRVLRNDPLRAGQIISTGTCIQSYYARPGDAVVAEFDSLPSVKVEFGTAEP